MRKLLLLTLLCTGSALYGQSVHDTYTADLFPDKGDSITVKTPTDSTFKVLESAASANTIYSRGLSTEGGGGDIFCNFRVVSNLSGTLNVQLQVGLYRGPGVGSNDDKSSDYGWEWNTLATITAVGATDYVLHDNDYVAKKPFRTYKYRIVETGAQKNHYVLNDHHFRTR